MPAILNSLQSGRNAIQATRINAGQQIRSVVGGVGGRLSLQENGNGNGDAIVVPPDAGVAGPMGLWPFPIINAIKGGGFGGGMYGGGAAPPVESAGLGVPSGAASGPGLRGTDAWDPARASTGMRIW